MSSYRLYGEGELIRLQQIVTRKELGFTLDSIARFLGAVGFDIAAVLGEQIDSLEKGAR